MADGYILVGGDTTQYKIEHIYDLEFVTRTRIFKKEFANQIGDVGSHITETSTLLILRGKVTEQQKLALINKFHEIVASGGGSTHTVTLHVGDESYSGYFDTLIFRNSNDYDLPWKVEITFFCRVTFEIMAEGVKGDVVMTQNIPLESKMFYSRLQDIPLESKVFYGRVQI